MKNLTDLEICKRIAEIEGFEFSVNSERVFYNCDGWPCAYNPLIDDALCFQLMSKYKIDWLNRASFKTGAAKIGDILVPHENPNKAICLAIIESMEHADENQD